MRWRFKRWMFGMRPAANAWEADYSVKLGAIGVVRGLRTPANEDDFTFLG